jgi:hypothetical protein
MCNQQPSQLSGWLWVTGLLVRVIDTVAYMPPPCRRAPAGPVSEFPVTEVFCSRKVTGGPDSRGPFQIPPPWAVGGLPP